MSDAHQDDLFQDAIGRLTSASALAKIDDEAVERLRPSGWTWHRISQAPNPAENRSKQISGDCHLRHLKGDIPGTPYGLRPDLVRSLPPQTTNQVETASRQA